MAASQAIAVALTLGIFSTPPARADSSESLATQALTVRICNLSSAGKQDLTEMEKSATEIFRHSGVNLLWIECSGTAGDPNGPATVFSGGSTLSLWVVNDSPQFSRHTLAWTTLNTYRLTVDYKRAEMLARASTGLSPGQILGHTVAHEIGHLLLGTGDHALFGIMKSSYDRRDLLSMAQGRLLFTKEQSRCIRSNLGSKQKVGESTNSLISPNDAGAPHIGKGLVIKLFAPTENTASWPTTGSRPWMTLAKSRLSVFI